MGPEPSASDGGPLIMSRPNLVKLPMVERILAWRYLAARSLNIKFAKEVREHEDRQDAW